MDRNPFISQNNDLFIMLFAGVTMRLAQMYIPAFSLQQQFMVILAFAFMCGMFMTFLYQSLEWALFFVLGIQLVSMAPYGFAYINKQPVMLPDLIMNAIEVGQYSCFLLTSWLIGVPVGMMLKRLVSTNYQRRGIF